MDRTPHEERTGQTKADAASCPLGCDRRGSARSLVRTDVSTGGRAGRRHLPNPFGASPPFRRGCHPPPERERESRPGRDSRRRAIARTNRNRSRRAPSEGRRRPDLTDRRGAFLATAVSRPDSVHGWVAVRLARSHASKCARLAALCGWKGAAVAKDRTGSRAPALVESRPGRSREPVSGRLLPSPIWSAGATRPARGTNVAAGRAADSYASRSSR